MSCAYVPLRTYFASADLCYDRIHLAHDGPPLEAVRRLLDFLDRSVLQHARCHIYTRLSAPLAVLAGDREARGHLLRLHRPRHQRLLYWYLAAPQFERHAKLHNHMSLLSGNSAIELKFARFSQSWTKFCVIFPLLWKNIASQIKPCANELE